MIRILLAALIAAAPLGADDAASKDRTLWSPSHKAALWLTPQADGKSKAQLLVVSDDGAPKSVWSDSIPTPAYVLVPDTASALVLVNECDAEKPDQGKVLTIRDGAGKVVCEYSVKDLLSDAEVSEVMLSGKPTAPWFRQIALVPGGAERTVVILTTSGREISLSLADGKRIELAEWVKQLGSDDWGRREEASARVRAAGEAALPLLAEAAGSPDPEVRVRAFALIDDCRWGGLRIPKEVLAELIASSMEVFRGKVVSVGESPGIWSGTIAAAQDVTYQLLETYKGKAAGESVTVSYYLVHGARLSDAQPRLHPGFFAPGVEHVVFARGTDKLMAWSESWSALPVVPGVIEAVKGK